GRSGRKRAGNKQPSPPAKPSGNANPETTERVTLRLPACTEDRCQHPVAALSVRRQHVVSKLAQHLHAVVAHVLSSFVPSALSLCCCSMERRWFRSRSRLRESRDFTVPSGRSSASEISSSLRS